jgi:TonB-linked SusC/RagA family outer membrane protein
VYFVNQICAIRYIFKQTKEPHPSLTKCFRRPIYQLKQINNQTITKSKIMEKRGKWYHLTLVFAIITGITSFNSSFLFAQQTKTINGIVVDAATNDPIPGVNVRIKDSKSGTSTNSEGKFTISAKSSNILVFSFISYESAAIAVGNKNTINVSLKPDENSLNEVVVIGYGTSKKQDLTGSVGIVDVKALANAPVLSFEQALAGRIAGVQVSSNQGQPGSEGLNIVIRGNGSLTQDNSPLYVIDGFPIEDFQAGSLNNDDIESINVLKDASATAIYGARGANGVIIIETKKGKVGAPVVTYSGSVGFQDIRKRMEMMSPYEFVRYQIERGNGAGYLKNEQTLESYRNIKGIDWQDQLFQNGNTNIQNFGLRGGTESTRYSVSGSVFDADGIIISTGQKRYQGRFALDQTFNKQLKAGINTNYSSTGAFGKEASLANTAGSATSYLLYGTLGYRPITGNIDLNDDDFEDQVVDEDIDPLQDYRINPIVSTKNEYRKVINNNLITNAYVSYDIVKGLTLKVTGGINTLNRRTESFFNSKTARGTPLLPSNVRGQWGSISHSQRIALSNENTLTYKKTFNKRHVIDAVIGYSLQQSRSEASGFTATNVPNESLGIYGLNQGLPLSNATSASIFRLESYLSRVNYSYNSKYLFTASFRADGSSKFINDNKWGYFPSGAFAWRMSNESFMKKLKFVSDAKLRTSFGMTGNNRVADFAAYAFLDPTNAAAYSYGNMVPTQGVAITSFGNPKLKWETTEQLDLGYDLSLFKNRIEFTVDAYLKTTRDLLLNANMPYHTGISTVYKNIGKIENRGLEFTLNTVNVKTKNFIWQSNFNISFNRNKILALADGENNIINNITWETAYNNSQLYISKIGQPAGQMYGYVWDGVYQFEDFDETSPGIYRLKSNIPTNNNDRTNITVKPGDIKYKDLNGDGVMNQFDQTVIGRGLPIHSGGFHNDFTYKGVQLGVLLQWAYGNDIFNANRLMFEGAPRASLNQFASYADRWTPDNPSNDNFRVGGHGPAGIYSSKVVEDGSYLRLKTVFLGYSLPQSVLKRIKIKNISLTAAAQNLFTWTNYSGFDPEVSTKNSVLTPGFDYSAYPQARTFVFGLKATL